MKKNFKNSFGVIGTPAQIQAFKEYAEGLGWKYMPHEFSRLHLWFSASNTFWHPVDLEGDSPSNVYHLPSQWAEAMQAASETVEEPKPTYDRGQKVINPLNQCLILCTCAYGDSDEYFEGVILSHSDGNSTGIYGTRWRKTSFTLHTSPVTL